LFELAQRLSFECEIHLAESAPSRVPHGIFLPCQFDYFCIFCERLPPNGEERFFERHGCAAPWEECADGCFSARQRTETCS